MSPTGNLPPFLRLESYGAARRRLVDELGGGAANLPDAAQLAIGTAEKLLSSARASFHADWLCSASVAPVLEYWIVQESHAGQRRPILTRSGSRLVIYKPRSLAVDSAWHGLLRWFEQAVGDPLSQPLEILACNGWGWSEVAAHRACKEKSSVDHYYRRLGRLAALIWTLGGHDATGSNIVAVGDLPTLIDPEMALVPGHLFFENVISVEFRKGAVAPFLAPDANGTMLSFGAAALRTGNCLHRRLVSGHAQRCPYCHHLPYLDAIPHFVNDYADAMARGFVDGLGVLLKNAPSLLCPSSPLTAFETATGRIVIRPSAVYAAIKDWMFARLRTDGCFPDAGALLRRLGAKHALEAGAGTNLLVEEEIRALQQGDLPRFEMPMSARVFEIAGKAVARFEYSGLERARGRLAGLSVSLVDAVSEKWRQYLRMAISPDLDCRGDAANILGTGEVSLEF